LPGRVQQPSRHIHALGRRSPSRPWLGRHSVTPEQADIGQGGPSRPAHPAFAEQGRLHLHSAGPLQLAGLGSPRPAYSPGPACAHQDGTGGSCSALSLNPQAGVTSRAGIPRLAASSMDVASLL
jgi:hypothetical protein